MSVRAIGGWVIILGRDILGLWDLNPHDLRLTLPIFMYIQV
jgi:hypothetical protein